MVDVGLKQETRRIAVASGRIQMRPETLRLIMEGKAPKGDVFATARIAAITGTKLTPFIVPLCHSIGVTGVEVELTPCSEGGQAFVFCQVSVSTVGRTGAEMEAMAGVASSLLAIYDMCKAVDRGMEITDVRLELKDGGKSGRFDRKLEAER
jgi:cyclic pyranopterin phosphate synthase